jgi:hypothetical protein
MTSDSKAAQPRSKNETRVSINSESNKQMPCICLDGAGAVVINQLQENLWRVMRQLTARTRDWRHSLDLHRSPSFRGPARTRRPVCCPLPEKPRVAGVAERRRRGAAGRRFGGARAARSPGGRRSRPSSPAWRSDELRVAGAQAVGEVVPAVEQTTIWRRTAGRTTTWGHRRRREP